MLSDVVDRLRCPHCCAALDVDEQQLLCRSGHLFDVARQGYVSLLPGRGALATGDSPAMVAARDTFLTRGHYAPIVAALRAELAEHVDCVAELGAGTGYYLAALLGDRADAVGIALDASKAAARRAARAHPRVGSVVADIWRGLPLADASVAVALVVFAPRVAVEFRRVLRPDGTLLVVTPTPRHLGELVGDLGLLRVDEQKPRRLHDAMAGYFARDHRVLVEHTMDLGREDVRSLVAMGPSARHLSPVVLEPRIAQLGATTPVTLSVQVSVYRPS